MDPVDLEGGAGGRVVLPGGIAERVDSPEPDRQEIPQYLRLTADCRDLCYVCQNCGGK